MDALALALWQFGVTTIYHFFFVPLTLGLSLLVAIMETLYVRTGNETYKRMTQFWGRLFLINFAMGVVTGLVQEFQFGMNWSNYSRFVGDIFGAPPGHRSSARITSKCSILCLTGFEKVQIKMVGLLQRKRDIKRRTYILGRLKPDMASLTFDKFMAKV